MPVLAGFSLLPGVLRGVKPAVGAMCIAFAIYAVSAWILLVHAAHRLTPEEPTTPDDAISPVTDDTVGEVVVETSGSGI